MSTLKVLASPIRWQILGYLGEHDEATATDVAHALGESTGTTSYHLRLLARHGLVEEAGMVGRRERPWRKVAQDLKFPAIGEDTPAAERDAQLAVHRLRLTEDLAHLNALAERDKPEEVAWSRMSRSSIRVSQGQLEQFGEDFRALVARYVELGAQAPDGEPTALVQLRLYAFPDLFTYHYPERVLVARRRPAASWGRADGGTGGTRRLAAQALGELPPGGGAEL